MNWIDIRENPPPHAHRCLVTNNIHATDRHGQMSHIWILFPIWSTDLNPSGHWVGFDAADRKIFDITHWMPLPTAHALSEQTPGYFECNCSANPCRCGGVRVQTKRGEQP